MSKIDSPDGQRSAVLFQRDCGATTGFSTQISLVKAGGPVRGSGNVFRADDDHGGARVGEWGGPWAEMKWMSANRLHVKYAENSRIFPQKNVVSGVQISFESARN